MGHDWLGAGEVESLSVVCPTAHLRRQWQQAAHRAGIQLRTEIPAGARRDGAYHGAALTYAQLAMDPDRYRELYGDGAVLFDELHHAGEGKTWADALLHAFGGAARRLALSGTPFRTDGTRIPFVEYDAEGVSMADFRYGYGDALEDGAVRPVYFVSYGGSLKWEKKGEVKQASFDQRLSRDQSSARLRTAVAAEGGWMSHALEKAHARLMGIRQAGHPDAGGLVVCMDQDHARAVAGRLFAITGRMPQIALSDDPNASSTISAFGASREPWIVAAFMISEGTDLPRLRVCVWATNVVSELFFRQVVGRVVRVTPYPEEQDAFVYVPADPRLLKHARSLAAERSHRLPPPKEGEPGLIPPEKRGPAGESDFRALHSSAGGTEIVAGATAQVVTAAELERARGFAEEFELPVTDEVGLAMLLRRTLGAAVGGEGGSIAVEDRRRALRAVLSRKVADYCRDSGANHRDLYRNLMKMARKSVEECDEEWLVLHIRYVERLLAA